MISLRSVVEIYNEHHVGIFLIKFLSRGFRFELDDQIMVTVGLLKFVFGLEIYIILRVLFDSF